MAVQWIPAPRLRGGRLCAGMTGSRRMMGSRGRLVDPLRHAPDHTFQPTYSFNTRPKDGLPMIVKRRS